MDLKIKGRAERNVREVVAYSHFDFEQWKLNLMAELLDYLSYHYICSL